MASMNDLINRGNQLAEKYSEDELKAALKNAVLTNDNEERLALQWALNRVHVHWHKFTKEQQAEADKRLAV